MSEELYQIEQIKQLKARYFRFLDTNDWKQFGQCLSEDCEARYSGGRLNLDGRDKITAFMTKHMSAKTLLSMHNGHHPEITIHSDSAASGVWYLQDTVIDLNRKTVLWGGAIYTDSYQKVDDNWQICKTAYERTFEIIEPMHEQHRVLQNMFEPKTG